MLRSENPIPQINRGETSDDGGDFRTMSEMPEKMHDYRMAKIRETLQEVRKNNWIYVGNAFREQPLAPSKP
ncbi:hypothetical protein GCK72_010284 [Caenorhabditis remanei]|nr:hypothetical protein GCK72_010284 [Caenorhabditis remanei]KAF1762023.1 hypothetical protein GCK72_010284 [Caenorhabditis remanei]